MKGVYILPLSALRVASIALRNPANKTRAVSLNEEEFRHGFGNAIPLEESNKLFAASAALPIRLSVRCSLILIYRSLMTVATLSPLTMAGKK
jgi:hypothetical protein